MKNDFDEDTKCKSKKLILRCFMLISSHGHHFTLLTFYYGVKTYFVKYLRDNLQLSGVDKLRAAERQAKASRVRLWKDYQPPTATYTGKEKDFTGTVFEVINGDAISVKSTTGQIKKVFLSSIRSPREVGK